MKTIYQSKHKRNCRIAISLTEQQNSWLRYLAAYHQEKMSERAYRIFSRALGAEMVEPDHTEYRMSTYREIADDNQ